MQHPQDHRSYDFVRCSLKSRLGAKLLYKQVDGISIWSNVECYYRISIRFPNIIILKYRNLE